MPAPLVISPAHDRECLCSDPDLEPTGVWRCVLVDARVSTCGQSPFCSRVTVAVRPTSSSVANSGGNEQLDVVAVILKRNVVVKLQTNLTAAGFRRFSEQSL